MKKIVLLLLFCMFLNESYSITVSGRVLDERRFPIPGVVVTIGSTVTTDANGKFSIPEVTAPYRVSVTNQSTNTTVLYDGLSIANPDLILFGNSIGKNANTAYMDVIVEGIPANTRGIIKFISTGTSYCKEEEIVSGEERKQIVVKWPAGDRSITGTIMYLEKDSRQFTRYAQRSVTLYKDSYPQSIKLNSFNTYENVNSALLTIYLPGKEFATKEFSIWADFLGYDRNSEIRLTTQNANIISAETFVPAILPMSFKLKVKAECFNSKGDGFINYTYTYPGSVINLTYETPPEIASPSNDFRNVNAKTIFSYTEGSGAGVYVVNFHCLYPESDMYIVTTGREMYFPGDASLKNANFTWNVAKYIPYFNTDSFVKPKNFNNEYSYEAVSYSKTYTFKTEW